MSFNLNSIDFFNQKLTGEYRNCKQDKERAGYKIFLLGCISATLTIVSYIIYMGIFETEISYTNVDYNNPSKDYNTSKDLSKSLLSRRVEVLPNKKLFLYIWTDYKQTNLQYLKSINYDQLSGKSKNLDFSLLGKFGKSKKTGKDFYPAGLLPATFFQDEIKIDGIELPEGYIVYSSEREMIGFTSYKKNNFTFPPEWNKMVNNKTIPLNFSLKSNKKLPILNDRFINWINVGNFPESKKLWGKFISESKYVNIDISPKKNYFKKRKIIITDGSQLGLKNLYFTLVGLIISLMAFLSSFLITSNTI